MDKENKRICMPYSLLHDKDVTETAKILYLLIAEHCDQEGNFCSNNEQLAKESGHMLILVEHALQELIDRGYIYSLVHVIDNRIIGMEKIKLNYSKFSQKQTEVKKNG